MEFHVVVNRYGRVLIFQAHPAQIRFIGYASTLAAAIELCAPYPTRLVKQG